MRYLNCGIGKTKIGRSFTLYLQRSLTCCNKMFGISNGPMARYRKTVPEPQVTCKDPELSVRIFATPAPPSPSPKPRVLKKSEGTWYSALHGPWCVMRSSAPTDSMYLVSVIPPTVWCRSFWNCTDVFDMVWSYACDSDIIFENYFHHFFIVFGRLLTMGP